jgi:hypothetical protein
MVYFLLKLVSNPKEIILKANAAEPVIVITVKTIANWYTFFMESDIRLFALISLTFYETTKKV